MIENKIINYLSENAEYDEYDVKRNLGFSTDDFWYDITDGGYLKPEKILQKANDIKEVKDAIEVLKKFKRSCENQIEDFIR